MDDGYDCPECGNWVLNVEENCYKCEHYEKMRCLWNTFLWSVVTHTKFEPNCEIGGE